MKIKIVSDGTGRGTRIVDAETGEPLDGSYAFEVKGNVRNALVEATIHCWAVQCEITAEGERRVRYVLCRGLWGHIKRFFASMFCFTGPIPHKR